MGVSLRVIQALIVISNREMPPQYISGRFGDVVEFVIWESVRVNGKLPRALRYLDKGRRGSCARVRCAGWDVVMVL